MKLNILLLSFVLSFVLFSSAQAMDFDTELDRIDSKYTLRGNVYSEDLKGNYTQAKDIIEKALEDLKGKKFGIVVGETHSLQGAKCFEILLVRLAKAAQIQHCLIELTPEKLHRTKKEGYGLGEESGFLQRLIREAEETGMTSHPIDRDVVTKETESLEQIRESTINAKLREEHFIQKIKELGDNFIFFTGSNHMASLYYDEELNQRFSLIFLNLSMPESAEIKQEMETINIMLNDAAYTEIFEQRKRFATETKYSYQMPVRYNKQQSKLYAMLMEDVEQIPGVNSREIRKSLLEAI